MIESLIEKLKLLRLRAFAEKKTCLRQWKLPSKKTGLPLMYLSTL